jgi:predicted Kef-type K+ transport protein
MSFSNTVFAVKVLEERGEMVSLHSRIYIGIFIVQDLATVLFLAISTSRLPSPWAISILLLIPLRPVLLKILERVGHGELLVL